jgi:hypothetical protein
VAATHAALFFRRSSGELLRIVIPEDDLALIPHYLTMHFWEDVRLVPVGLYERHKNNIDAIRAELRRMLDK